ncbi:MAG: hypothetical protein II973_11065 [Spirochaetaceae bacterium]|nr:hypothetical protein [Spirochaetaceae bacterium]
MVMSFPLKRILLIAAFKEDGEPFSISDIRYASCGEPDFLEAGAATITENGNLPGNINEKIRNI